MSPAALLMAHWLGALLLGAGLAYGTWAWHRVRRLERLAQDTRPTLQRLHRIYLISAVPGSLLLLASGGVLIATRHGWAGTVGQPWLLAMLAVTLLEFTEGITVTRHHLARALAGRSSAGDLAPHLDLPLYAAVLWLGITRPAGWWPVIAALGVALGVALMAWRAARLGRY
ncbi:MAG: hypothetical protein JNJ71_13290 [Rubrivivax sp.]|nr:hypothetical protein [Rubrivivax sp.]